MEETLETKKRSALRMTRSEEPEELRIVLLVCDCYDGKHIAFVKAGAERVSKLLDVSMQNLERIVADAILTRMPQIVACYKNRDIAKTRLVQLNGEIPFIKRSCHSFDITE